MFTLERLASVGRYILAAAFIAFGVQDMLCLKPTFGLEPLPAWLPAIHLWIIVTALVLIGSGLGVMLRWRAGLFTAVPGVLLTLWILVLHLPKLIAAPANGSLWTCVFETVAIASAAWALAGALSLSPADAPGQRNLRAALAIRLGQLGYGISLPVFGVLHIIYWRYIVSVLPTWLPWPLFWAYFTAAAFFAAGAAITSGIRACSAAMWTGIMFLSWVLILHGPRVAMNAGSRAEWTSLLVALAMGGGAWVVADALRHNPRPAIHTSLPAN